MVKHCCQILSLHFFVIQDGGELIEVRLRDLHCKLPQVFVLIFLFALVLQCQYLFAYAFISFDLLDSSQMLL